MYFEIGTRIGLDWLRDQVERLRVEGSWHAAARTELRQGVFHVHRRITERVLARRVSGMQGRIAAWLEGAGADLERWQRMLTEMRAAGSADFATLSVGLESVRKLAD